MMGSTDNGIKALVLHAAKDLRLVSGSASVRSIELTEYRKPEILQYPIKEKYKYR